MHALGAKLACERLCDATLGKLAGGKSGKLGRSTKGSSGTGDDERGWVLRVGIDCFQELGKCLLRKIEETIAVFFMIPLTTSLQLYKIRVYVNQTPNAAPQLLAKQRKIKGKRKALTLQYQG